MRIAFFPSAYYPSVGGVEEMTRQLATECQAQGHAVRIYTNRWPKDLTRSETIGPLQIRREILRVGGGNFRRNAAAAFLGSLAEASLAADFRQFKPDVLHLHCISSNAIYARRLVHKFKIPFVLTLHGELTMDASGSYRRDARALAGYADAVRKADFVTACSRHTLAEAERILKLPLNGISGVVHNGVDTREFDQAKPYPHLRPYLLAIGRLVHQKGFDVLLRAYANFVPPGAKPDLLIAGDGADRAKLESLTGILNLREQVHFVGRVDRSVTAALFVGSEFVVVPSRQEPFGIVNLEAMAAGKAVIATRVGGVSEVVVDGTNGLLIPADDPSALTKALQTLWCDPILRAKFSSTGRSLAEALSWNTIARSYLDIYRRVITS